MRNGFFIGIILIAALVIFEGDTIGKAFGGMINAYNQTVDTCK